MGDVIDFPDPPDDGEEIYDVARDPLGPARIEGVQRLEALFPELIDDPSIDVVEVRRELRFCELLIAGTARLDAAIEVGWSLAQYQAKLREDPFLELVDAVEHHKNDTIEGVLFQKARYGNMDAIKMWLYNRYPERWRDVRRIEVDDNKTIKVDVAVGVRDSVLAAIRSGSTAALQPGGVIETIAVEEKRELTR